MQSALAKVSEIKEVKTKLEDKTCSFKVAKGFDYKTKLDELVDGGTNDLAKWKVLN